MEKLIITSYSSDQKREQMQKLMKEYKITQTELATACGLSRQAINYYTKNNSTYSDIDLIFARILKDKSGKEILFSYK